MNLQEIITAKVPGAVYTEAGDGMFTIPVEQFTIWPGICTTIRRCASIFCAA